MDPTYDNWLISSSIQQEIDHKIRIEGSIRSNVLKPSCTKSAGEPILDAHFHQLTSATGARSESYAYDVNGNRNATGYTVGTGGTLSASPNARL